MLLRETRISCLLPWSSRHRPLDLSPQHLIKLLALAQPRQSRSQVSSHHRHRLISRLLPKASIKFSIQEPVLRFVLPVANLAHAGRGTYDMIISSISSVSLDVESSHSAGGELLYSLSSNFRLLEHKLYYQASTGVRHNLIITEALEVKVELTASTAVSVAIHGNLRTFSVLMVRDEVSKAIYNIVRHFKNRYTPEKVDGQKPPRTAFLRKLPTWLIEASFEGSGCSFEAAGVDPGVSGQTRGVAFELESWSAQYTSTKSESGRKHKGRKTSTSVRYDDHFLAGKTVSSSLMPSKQHRNSDPTDGRRLACHVRGFDGFIIESADAWEPAPFFSVPRLEVAVSTSRDHHGPLCHIHSTIHAVYPGVLTL